MCIYCATHVPQKLYINLKSDFIQLFQYLSIQFMFMFMFRFTPYLTFSVTSFQNIKSMSTLNVVIKKKKSVIELEKYLIN